MRSLLLFLYISLILAGCQPKPGDSGLQRPNILLIISDDHSYPHTGAYGCEWVNTPGFDRISRDGVLFTNCYSASPSCSPSRASILTGKNIWELEEAGVHISGFPNKYKVFPDLLEEAGYKIGYTGKPWSPGNWKDYGWNRNPAGPAYARFDTIPPARGMSKNNYAKNFKDFYHSKDQSQAFCFWLGVTEPHRGYEFASGIRSGIDTSRIKVPRFLPDRDTVKIDLADYALEIEYFVSHVVEVLKFLEDNGELDQTLVIITGDNGMPFPRAKQNCYEYGVHVPLAVCWGEYIRKEQVCELPVGFSDFFPTILEAAGIPQVEETSGLNFLGPICPEFKSNDHNSRDCVVFGKERHSYSRPDNRCYPIRGIRQGDYLYLINFKPDRWPSGIAPFYRDSELGQISGKVISRNMNHDAFCLETFHKTVDLRPGSELYNIIADPACFKNLANMPAYKELVAELDETLREILHEQGDPRVKNMGDCFEAYPRFRPIPDWLEEGSLMGGWFELGEYNPIIMDAEGDCSSNRIVSNDL